MVRQSSTAARTSPSARFGLGADRLQPLQIALPVDLEVHERFEKVGFAAIAGRRVQHRLERAVGVAAPAAPDGS